MLNPSLLTGEARRITFPNTEAVKTMKQIGTIARPGASRDAVDGAALSYGSAQGAIGRHGTFDVSVADGQPQAEQEDDNNPEHAKPSQHTIAEGHERSPFPRAKSHTILVTGTRRGAVPPYLAQPPDPGRRGPRAGLSCIAQGSRVRQ